MLLVVVMVILGVWLIWMLCGCIRELFNVEIVFKKDIMKVFVGVL